MTSTFCIADCGCAGGQPAATCCFDPSCPKCRELQDPCNELILELERFYDDPMTDATGMGGEMTPLVIRNHVKRHNCQGMGG